MDRQEKSGSEGRQERKVDATRERKKERDETSRALAGRCDTWQSRAAKKDERRLGQQR